MKLNMKRVIFAQVASPSDVAIFFCLYITYQQY